MREEMACEHSPITNEILPYVNLWVDVLVQAIDDALRGYDFGGQHITLPVGYFLSPFIQPVIETVKGYGKMQEVYTYGFRCARRADKVEKFEQIMKLID